MREFPRLLSVDRGRLYSLSFVEEQHTACISISIYDTPHNRRSIEGVVKRAEGLGPLFETDYRHGFGEDGCLLPYGVVDETWRLDAYLTPENYENIAVAYSHLLHALNVIGEDAAFADRRRGGKAQLLEIEPSLARDPAPMDGVLSPQIVRWLQTKQESDLTPVRHAMFHARNAISLYPESERIDAPNRYFPMELTLRPDGWLGLAAGGASCQVDEQHYTEGKGYRIYSHNIDFAFKQIIMLAGFAALYDLASKELDLRSP